MIHELALNLNQNPDVCLLVSHKKAFFYDLKQTKTPFFSVPEPHDFGISVIFEIAC